MANFWYAENFEKKDLFKLLSYNLAGSFFILIRWIVSKIGILGLKMVDLQPFLYLERCQKLNQLIFFNPVFAKSFLWLFWVIYSKMIVFSLAAKAAQAYVGMIHPSIRRAVRPSIRKLFFVIALKVKCFDVSPWNCPWSFLGSVSWSLFKMVTSGWNLPKLWGIYKIKFCSP